MNRKILYKISMLILVALLQIYFFDRLPSYSYIQFSFYLAYVLLLSVNTPFLFVLISSTALGAMIDMATGTGGLITVAITASAYTRILLLRRMLSEDSTKYDFSPSIKNMGANKWFFYCITIVFVNAILLVILESGVLLFVRLIIFNRLIINIVSSTLLLYLVQLVFNKKPKSSY